MEVQVRLEREGNTGKSMNLKRGACLKNGARAGSAWDCMVQAAGVGAGWS